MTLNYSKTGAAIYAIAILAIGIIHFAFHNFPLGLLPVPATVPGREILIYAAGAALVIAGLLILLNKYANYGAYLAAIIWLLLLVLVHLPKLFMKIHDGAEWTGTFEVVSLLSGACMVAVSNKPTLFYIGKYLFIISLIVFGVQHYMYAQYVATLVPAWLPGHLFWTYAAMVGFLATAVSLLINVMVKTSTLLLCIMFIIWVLMLHLPRSIASPKVEPEWTSMLVALAMSGITLLSARVRDSYRTV